MSTTQFFFKQSFKLTLFTAAAILAGCAVGPDYKVPASTPVPTQQFAAGADAVYSTDAPIAAFWNVFEDATLRDLVQQALTSNHDLRIALSSLNEARALRRETRLDYLPQITTSAGYTRQRQSADELAGFGAASNGRHLDLYTGGFDAYWELDLFGGIRRLNEASVASEQSLQANLADAQISVAAEVARTYFELRGAQERLAVAQRNADNQKGTLDYTQARLKAGRGTEFDTARAQAQLDSTLAVLPALETVIDNGIHRLSVLTGQVPNALSSTLKPTQALPELPRLVNIGQPEDLLRRRADIRAAERRLAASTAQIGVATSDLFPRITFTGEVGFAVNSLSDAGKGFGESYRFGPGISWAAFDLGRVKARIEQTKARNDGTLAAYEQTVLRALEETENALTSYGRSRQQLDHLRSAATASDRAAELAHKRYDGGATDFLSVLDAERAQLQAQDALSQARTASATGLIALYKSLGGGWNDGSAPQAVAAAK